VVGAATLVRAVAGRGGRGAAAFFARGALALAAFDPAGVVSGMPAGASAFTAAAAFALRWRGARAAPAF